ncbi:MAG: DEAD/DEAH box helicase family protein, partial [Gammaproteobacteria bacterium]|nr:DEAD/DEAH box helicase family protein [Gammaproteobacteria bacterium]
MPDGPAMADESHAGLTDEVKAEIQEAYRNWLAARGFKPRRGQREMIAEIARALSAESDRLCVVEAGTGTGKTIAYCLAAIPLARALDKHVVIATATVALQEQVALRDLPDLKRHTGLDFKSTLAKGRSRYVCLKRLDDRIGFDSSREAPLFEPPDAEAVSMYRRLQAAFADGTWDGDRDSWPEGVSLEAWASVTNDRAGCGAGRCSYYHQCPFFKARQQAADVDVVVANHDLVLADLGLGGGVVLPDPAETIYVFDEAHH